MKKTGILIIVISFFFNINGNSQDYWSLERCIHYAHENNLQIKQAELSANLSDNTLKRSKAAVLPDLNFGASQSFSYGKSVDPFTQGFQEQNVKSTNLGLSSSWDLFRGFQNYNTIQQSELDLKASLQDVERIKNDISLNIASAYLQILFSYELVEISKNQMGTTIQQVERTQKLVEAGSVARGNLLEIESQLAQEELQLVNAQNQLITSYLTLSQFLDLDSVEGFIIERPELPELLEEEISLTVNDIYNIAKGILPQIKRQEYRLQSSEKELALARGYLLPNLRLNTSYGTGYSDAITLIDSVTLMPIDYPFKDQIGDNKSFSFSLNLQIPIFNKLQVKTAMDNAKINVLQSQNEYQLVTDQLYKDIQQAHSNATASLKKYIASKKAVQSTREAFRYTEQKYEVGNVNSVDYAIAKTNLLRARSDNLQAKYEYMFSMKILDFYRGKQFIL